MQQSKVERKLQTKLSAARRLNLAQVFSKFSSPGELEERTKVNYQRAMQLLAGDLDAKTSDYLFRTMEESLSLEAGAFDVPGAMDRYSGGSTQGGHPEAKQVLQAARAGNLRALVQMATSKAAFAAATGLSTASLHNYTTRNTTHVLGFQFSRAVEVKLGLPAGTMDVPNAVEPHLAAVVERFGFDRNLQVARIENLKALVAIAGGLDELSSVVGIDSGRLNTIITRAGPARMTDIDKAKVESELDLPKDSMDKDGTVELFQSALKIVFAFRQSAATEDALQPTRAGNLRALVAPFGRAAFCEATGLSMATVNFELSPKAARRTGPGKGNLFRQLEELLGMPHRSMDSMNWLASLHPAASAKLHKLVELTSFAPSVPRRDGLARILNEFQASRLVQRGVSPRALLHASQQTFVPPAFCREVEERLALPPGILDDVRELANFMSDMRALVVLAGNMSPEAVDSERVTARARLGALYAGVARDDEECSAEEDAARSDFIADLANACGGVSPLAHATGIDVHLLESVCRGSGIARPGPIGRLIESKLGMTFDDVDSESGLKATLEAVATKVRALNKAAATTQAVTTTQVATDASANAGLQKAERRPRV